MFYQVQPTFKPGIVMTIDLKFTFSLGKHFHFILVIVETKSFACFSNRPSIVEAVARQLGHKM